MCVKDTGTKYQLWISDFNIDGAFTRVHPFIISHTKTMTRIRKDGKEEAWRDMPREAIEYIKSLPEFDGDMFYEITGIK